MTTKNYDSAFGAFDIRAVRHDPIDDSFAYTLGLAIGADLIKRKGPEASFLFGCDAREWNNTLGYWFLKGMEESGVRNYIGMGLSVDSPEEQSQERGVCSTAMLYNFVAGDFDMGAMFTASHNPPEYAGMKIVNEHGHLIPTDQLKSLVTEWEDISDVPVDMDAYTRIWEMAMMRDDSYRDRLYTSEKKYRETLQDLFGGLTRHMKIVIDFSNGGAIGYERTFLDGLMNSNELLEFIYLNDTADSTFAAHLSDTTNTHDYEQLMAAVVEHKADMGVMFDGDGDRLGYVDELGAYIPGDVAGGLIALHILAQSDKKNVIHDVFTSRGVTDAITQAGGTAIKSRVGHRFVKEKFQEHSAAFGGEISGHQFFNEIGGFESPMCALGHFLIQAQESESVSAAIAPLLTTYKPPLIKLHVDDRESALSSIEAYYSKKGYEIDHTDGVGIYTPERWVVLRPSQTEPILRLCIETQDKEQYDEVLKEIEREIKG